jgi:hypothetical protein
MHPLWAIRARTGTVAAVDEDPDRESRDGDREALLVAAAKVGIEPEDMSGLRGLCVGA